MTGIVLNLKVCASFDKRLNTFQVRVKRSPGQGRVAGVVAVVDERNTLGSVRR